MLQYVGCSIALPVAAAFATLILATEVSQDEVVLPGYPQLLHETVPLGSTERGKEGSQSLGNTIALETVTTVTVALLPDTAALARLGAACFAAVLAFAAYAVWHEDVKQRRKTMVKPSGVSGPNGI